MPTGKGKSRIIAAVIALAAHYDKEKKFTIVYSSELLRSVDYHHYELLANLLHVEIQQLVFDQ